MHPNGLLVFVLMVLLNAYLYDINPMVSIGCISINYVSHSCLRENSFATAQDYMFIWVIFSKGPLMVSIRGTNIMSLWDPLRYVLIIKG